MGQRIAIHDANMIIIDHMSNDIPKALHYDNDMFDLYLSHGSTTYTFEVEKFLNGKLNERVKSLTTEAYFSFKYRDDDYLFSVIDIDDRNGRVIKVTGETLNLAMLNENAPAFENKETPYTFEEYFNILRIGDESKIRIGKNEIEDYEGVFEWTSESTNLARILDLVNKFKAECKFRTILYPNGQLNEIVVDVYKARTYNNLEYGVGKHRKDVRLYIDINNEGITSSQTKANLFNAVRVIGKNGEYLKVSKERKIVNEEGKNEIIAPRRSNTIYAPLSMMKYPSITRRNNCDNWITREFKTEYETEDEFWEFGVDALSKYMYPEVEYDVPMEADRAIIDNDLSIGDSIYFTDKHYFDYLILLARIIQMSISFARPKTSKIKLANYVKIKNQISKSLKDEMAKMAQDAMPVFMDISTTNGTSFTNNQGSSLITPTLRKGREVIKDGYSFIYYMNGLYVGTGNDFEVKPEMLINNQGVLTIEGYINAENPIKSELSFTNTNDGVDGTPGTDGKDGRSITSVEQYYLLSNNYTGVTTSTPGWSQDVKNPTADLKYLWVYRVEKYSDDTEKLFSPFIYSMFAKDGSQGLPGPAGADGKDGVDGKTSYIHTAYAKTADGLTGFSTSDATDCSYMGQYSDFNPIASQDYKKYTWVLFKGKDGLKGDQGLPGPAGKDSYAHIAWAESITGTNMSQDPSPTRKYMGYYVDNLPSDSTDPARYKWTKSLGEDGKDGAQGIPGVPGADGKTPYFHRAWANSSDGTVGFSTTDPTNKRFLGTVSDFTLADPTNPSAYKWTALFENIEAGGMNLISNTKDMSGNLRPAFNTKNEYLGYTVAEGIAPAAGQYVDVTTWNTDSIPTGDTYIISFYAKASVANTTMTNYFYYPNTTISALNSTGHSSTSPVGDSIITLTTEWKHYWIIWKQTTPATNKSIIIGRNFSSTATVSIAGVAMFAGNSQKEWMPSMNDLYSLNKIGGVNILRNGTFELTEVGNTFTVGGVTYNTKPTYWSNYNSGIPNPTTSYHAYVDKTMSETNVIAFNESDGSRNWKAIAQNINTKLLSKTSNDYVFSFDYYATIIGNVKLFGGFYYTSKSKGTILFHAGHFSIPVTRTDVWDRLSGKVPFDSADCDFTKPVRFYVYSYNYTGNGILYIDKLMLENATIASPYSDSPEDTRDLIDSKADEVFVQQQTQALQESLLIVKAEAEAAATLGELSELIARHDKLEADWAAGVQVSEQEFIDIGLSLAKIQVDLGSQAQKWTMVDSYMTVQNDGLVFGNSKSNTAIKITDDRISMFSDNNEAMWIDKGAIHIENGIFSKTIQIGNFIEEQSQVNPNLNTVRFIG